MLIKLGKCENHLETQEMTIHICNHSSLASGNSVIEIRVYFLFLDKQLLIPDPSWMHLVKPPETHKM